MPNFTCDVCGKALTTAHSLKDHKRIHSGERPFHCEICNSFFSCSSNLIQHMVTAKFPLIVECTNVL